jgi:hypothetical protein
MYVLRRWKGQQEKEKTAKRRKRTNPRSLLLLNRRRRRTRGRRFPPLLLLFQLPKPREVCSSILDRPTTPSQRLGSNRHPPLSRRFNRVPPPHLRLFRCAGSVLFPPFVESIGDRRVGLIGGRRTVVERRRGHANRVGAGEGAERVGGVGEDGLDDSSGVHLSWHPSLREGRTGRTRTDVRKEGRYREEGGRRLRRSVSTVVCERGRRKRGRKTHHCSARRSRRKLLDLPVRRFPPSLLRRSIPARRSYCTERSERERTHGKLSWGGKISSENAGKGRRPHPFLVDLHKLSLHGVEGGSYRGIVEVRTTAVGVEQLSLN